MGNKITSFFQQRWKLCLLALGICALIPSCAWIQKMKAKKALKLVNIDAIAGDTQPATTPPPIRAVPVATTSTASASPRPVPPYSASLQPNPRAQVAEGELSLPLSPDLPNQAIAAQALPRQPIPLPPLPQDAQSPLRAQPLLPTAGAEPAFQNLTQAAPAPVITQGTIPPMLQAAPTINSGFQVTEAMVQQGEANAQIYCATCHAMPSPQLLDRDTWLGSVLPAMSPGGSRHTPIAKAQTGTFSLETMNNPLLDAKIHAQLIPEESWNRIVDFYANRSPEKLSPASPNRPINFDLPGFKIEFPQHAPGKPATNAIRIDPTTGRILVGATDPNMFVVFDQNLKLIQEARLSSPPTWFETMTGPDGKRRLGLTLAGDMDPNDRAEGTLVMVEEQNQTPAYNNPLTLLSRLRRPVNTRFGDLNADGIPDTVVAQFGDTIGQLAWYESSQNRIIEHVLIPRPGAIRTQVIDWDQDGDQDVVVLMTQAREGVYLLRNDGRGNFREQLLVATPPVYGASSFELVDFNGDGKLDILQTCGDNADYSMIFKPYHGIYIWLNAGGDQFKQGYFYPINGAFNAVARDFDLDGDLDIASIAYFPDYQLRPFESFVYFQNQGNAQQFDFHPFTFEGSLRGRWLPMDVGDVDQDGDEDIVLGNFLRALMGPGRIPDDLTQKWAEPGPYFVLLRNQAR